MRFLAAAVMRRPAVAGQLLTPSWGGLQASRSLPGQAIHELRSQNIYL